MSRGSSWAYLRSIGHKQCVYSVRTSSKSEERSRTNVRFEGHQCARYVPPKRIEMRGLPICDTHWPPHLEDLERDESTRAALRRKYDPGPLYNEDDL